MPRPNKDGTAGKQHSPINFISWLENRKARRQQAEEKAARLITNKIAENENIIIDTLSSIDFYNSKLPKNALERKAREDQPCGDLEYAANCIISLLRKNPQTITMDIRKIDQNLLTLVLLFKQTVEQGDVRAAFAAKVGIIRAVNDIRCRIPHEQPQLATAFVEANAKYLEQWITLVTLAQVADRTKQNTEAHRSKLEQSQKRHDEDVEELKNRIQKDPPFLTAWDDLINRKVDSNRANWTPIQREVHRLMVERRMNKANLEMNSVLLQQSEMDLSIKEQQVEALDSKLAAIKIVTDPDLMNKYQEAIDELFKEMAESDAQIDEALKTMDYIEGRIEMLGKSPGAIRAMEVAAEEAEKTRDEILAYQKDKSGETARHAKETLEKWGILSDEQLAEQKKQAELDMQRTMDSITERLEAQEQEQEREMLTN